MPSHRIYLTVEQQSKSIPYPARSGADFQTFAFRPMKGKPEKVDSIKEAQGHPALIEILKTLNAKESPFFSVGCEKHIEKKSAPYWVRGFVEFSYNHVELVSDASSYFPLFYHFNRISQEFLKTNLVTYWFGLNPATFTKVESPGFSCCVYITTADFQTEEEAYSSWSSGLSHLSEYLATQESFDLKPIYGK